MTRRAVCNMIYRILVDHRRHAFTIRYFPKRCFVIDEQALGALACGNIAEREAARLLTRFGGTLFADKGAFIDAMFSTLGQDRFAVLEQRLVALTFRAYTDDKWISYPFDGENKRRLLGASFGRLAAIMFE